MVELVKNLLRKINWETLKVAARNLSLTDIDEIVEITEEVLQNEESLKKIHKLLFDVHLIEGFLICPESGRKFPVKEGTECISGFKYSCHFTILPGIPNMLLHEDEV